MDAIERILRTEAASATTVKQAAALTIQNVVTTCVVVNAETGEPCEFNLARLEQKMQAHGATLKCATISAMIMRHLERVTGVTTTALWFRSARLVDVGARSKAQSRRGIQGQVDEVNRVCGYNLVFRDLMVQNIVSTYNSGFRVNLELMRTHPELWTSQIRYDSELFPGLMLTRQDPTDKVAFLVFAGGAVIIAGARNMAQQQDSYEYIYRILGHAHIRRPTAGPLRPALTLPSAAAAAPKKKRKRAPTTGAGAGSKKPRIKK